MAANIPEAQSIREKQAQHSGEGYILAILNELREIVDNRERANETSIDLAPFKAAFPGADYAAAQVAFENKGFTVTETVISW